MSLDFEVLPCHHFALRLFCGCTGLSGGPIVRECAAGRGTGVCYPGSSVRLPHLVDCSLFGPGVCRICHLAMGGFCGRGLWQRAYVTSCELHPHILASGFFMSGNLTTLSGVLTFQKGPAMRQGADIRSSCSTSSGRRWCVYSLFDFPWCGSVRGGC